MGLDRQSVTVASRVMLPAYVLLFGYLAVNYLATPRGRLVASSEALAYADRLMPMPGWGVVFALNALIMLTALILGGRGWARDVFTFALWVGIVTLVIYAGVFAAAALTTAASPGALAWPLFGATACFASQRSLTAREV